MVDKQRGCILLELYVTRTVLFKINNNTYGIELVLIISASIVVLIFIVIVFIVLFISTRS